MLLSGKALLLCGRLLGCRILCIGRGRAERRDARAAQDQRATERLVEAALVAEAREEAAESGGG